MNNIPSHKERIQQGQIQDFGKAAGGGGGDPDNCYCIKY